MAHLKKCASFIYFRLFYKVYLIRLIGNEIGNDRIRTTDRKPQPFTKLYRT